MVILIIVGLGAMSLFNLQVDSMPNMDIPMILIRTSYAGAGPEEVLEQVTKPVENAVSTIEGLDSITSNSGSGQSMVMMEFDQDIDIDQARQDVNDTLNSVTNSLPDDAGAPTVMNMEMNATSIMTVSVSSETLSQLDLKTKVDNDLTERLQNTDGVASIDVMGGMEKEIVVELIEARANHYGVTLSDISQLLSAENNDTPGGNVREGTQTINLKTRGALQSVDDIKNLTLTLGGGANILLRDVANISEQFREVTSYSYINENPNITIEISKQSTANTVSVSDELTAEITEMQAEFPELQIRVTSDSAEDVRTSIGAVAQAAWQGMLLAVLILFIFLRNIRSTIVVALAMPISIVGTFSLMYFGGLTLNTMSLSGLVLGVGMLVDNSIVVLESVFRRMEEGEPRIQAAINGAKEVAMSITASTLTTIAVFLPIAFLGGLVAQYFNDLAFTIAFSLLASLVIALTFVPMACSLILVPETQTQNQFFRKISDGVNSGITGLTAAYKRALNFALKRRKTVILASVAFFLLTMLSLRGLGQEFMTFGSADEINLNLSLPSGTILDEAVKVADEAQTRLEAFDDVIETNTLRINSNQVRFQIALIDGELRDKDNDMITSEIRQAMSTIAGAEVSTGMRMFGGGSGGGVNIQITGSELETLAQIGDDFVEILNGIDGIVEAASSVSSANQDAVVTVDRAKAAQYGVSANTIAGTVNNAINGISATTIKTGGDEISVEVRYPEDKLIYLTDVLNLMVNAGGTSVPLSELASIQKENAAQTISRLDQNTYITISASLEGLDSGTASTLIAQAINDHYVMPNGYEWSFGGNQRNMAEAFSGLGVALVLSLFLVYAIMAAEFESLYYPFIIMFSIPVALSGGLFGLRLLNTSLSITAYLGLIMLAGIVVNNAIVLIDYINILRRERGMDIAEAVQKAGPVRLRAILMSSGTTVVGLIPMMLGLAEGSETMQPLAIVIVFGLTLSTLVTLLLIPALYMSLDSVLGRLFRPHVKMSPAAKL
jgi:HAE1 family hydrophobic/amphiphilic exporter-1